MRSTDCCFVCGRDLTASEAYGQKARDDGNQIAWAEPGRGVVQACSPACYDKREAARPR